MNIAGIYSCYDDPDEDSWVNHHAIFLFQDESRRLAYSLLIEKEHNYGRSYVFEEGFVYLEVEGRELHFEQQHRYEYASGRAMGYDLSYYHSYTSQPQQVIQIFHVFHEAEIANESLAKRLIVNKATKMVLFEKEKDLLYERIYEGQRHWLSSAEYLQTIILDTREMLHKDWQDMVKNFVLSRLAQGVEPEEIAANCDWTLQTVRAHQRKIGNLAKLCRYNIWKKWR